MPSRLLDHQTPNLPHGASGASPGFRVCCGYRGFDEPIEFLPGMGDEVERFIIGFWKKINATARSFLSPWQGKKAIQLKLFGTQNQNLGYCGD